MAKLCNTTPWVIDATPAEVVKPYIELLAAIDQANYDISQDNEARIRRKETKLLQRITLAD